MEREIVNKMLENSNVFSIHEFDVGCSKSMHLEIKSTVDKPFRERSLQLPTADLEALRVHLSLKGAGPITESPSPYASPMRLFERKMETFGYVWISVPLTDYRSGVQSIDVDALSRRPHTDQNHEDCWKEIPADGVRAMCKVVKVVLKDTCHERTIDHLGLSMHAIPKAYCNLSSLQLKGIPILNPSEISRAHQEYLTLTDICNALKQNNRRKVITLLHDDSGHLGIDKTYGLIEERFYWPKMKSDVEEHYKNRARCIRITALPKRVSPLFHLHSNGPIALVCMDLLYIKPDCSHTEKVLVIIDHYIKRKDLRAAYDLAEAAAAKQNEGNKQTYYLRVKFTQLLPGDRVLIRNL